MKHKIHGETVQKQPNINLKKENEPAKPPFSKSNIIGWLVLGFFFLSGFTSLIYEILWSRFIIEVIGSAPFAVSIVLTVFMGGLGIGALIGAKLVSRVPHARFLLVMYGAFEFLAGLYGLILPLLLKLFKPVAAALYNSLYTSFLPYHLIIFMGCAVLLILPTIFMGATLPVLSAFYVNRFERLGRQAGRLYGMNTVGAALGSLVCGFVLIRVLGMNGSLFLAVGLNTLIGFSAVCLGRSVNWPEHDPARDTAVTPAPESIPVPENSFPVWPALAMFAVSGFTAMACQVIWTRLLGLIVGPTTYSFTIVVTSFILGLAIGSMVFGYIADRNRSPLKLLIFTQIGAAIAVILISHLLGNSEIFFAKLIFRFEGQFLLLATLKILVLFAFFIVPTVLFGAAFPLVLRIITPSLARVGRSVGVATALNTAGAVLGAFAAGFVLIPLMGKESSIRFIVVLQLAAASAGGLMLYRRNQAQLREWLSLCLPVVFVMILLVFLPYWNRDLLSVGRYHRVNDEQLASRGWIESLLFAAGSYTDENLGEMVYFSDGIGGFTTVSRHTNTVGDVEFSLYNNGKPDASSDAMDMYSQTLIAHFPLLFSAKPDTVMVLGLASGITAGEALHYPVKKLDIVDINKEVRGASDFFRPWNNNVLDDSRVELIIQDGRAHLELTKRRYDLIISEPSNPWMAGLASLFTKEFFTMARNRLKPDGMFAQWIHGYQIDWDSFALVGRTFAEVFPNSILVDIDPSDTATDYLLVGINGDNTLDPEIARGNLQYARLSTNIDVESPLSFYRLIDADNLPELFGKGPLNTDNDARLEYNAPRVMYTYETNSIQERIEKNGRLDTKLAELKDQVLHSVDEQIGYAAIAFSFESPFPGMVNLAGATAEQRVRFQDMARNYCGAHYVNDFRFIGDDQIERTCMQEQLAFSLKHTDPPADQPSMLYHIGNLYALLEEYENALEWYRLTCEVDPGNYLVHYNMGSILSMEGRFDEAEREYRESLHFNPDHALSFNNLGNVYARQKKFKEAVPFYREALKLDPTISIAHRNLGNVLKALGMTEESNLQIHEADSLDAAASVPTP